MEADTQASGRPTLQEQRLKKLLSFPKKNPDHLSQPEAMDEMTVTNK